jgi:Tannase and feruloyl esterase
MAIPRAGPGDRHCRGGEGPDDFDMQPVMEQWLEKQKAPESVIASKITDGKVERTRPLCPYPQVAVWNGRWEHRRRSQFRLQITWKTASGAGGKRIKRARQSAQYPWFVNKKPWQKEIELMLKNAFKREVEALITKGISYVTEEYVPARLRTRCRIRSWREGDPN